MGGLDPLPPLSAWHPFPPFQKSYFVTLQFIKNNLNMGKVQGDPKEVNIVMLFWHIEKYLDRTN